MNYEQLMDSKLRCVFELPETNDTKIAPSIAQQTSKFGSNSIRNHSKSNPIVFSIFSCHAES